MVNLVLLQLHLEVGSLCFIDFGSSLERVISRNFVLVSSWISLVGKAIMVLLMPLRFPQHTRDTFFGIIFYIGSSFCGQKCEVSELEWGRMDT